MEINECDRLRHPDRVYEQDSRTGFFVNVDRTTGATSERVIEDQYGAVACFELNETVPKEVTIHFETAKNLYLYAWFVYRFYPVAEQQALASLEFALRERLPEFVESERRKSRHDQLPGLYKLLGHAIKNGCLRNEKFVARERWARERAESRHSYEIMKKMAEAGVDSMEWDDADVEVTPEDLAYDWLGIFQQTIHKVRNDHAHGGPTLSNNVCHSFELVSELINQLYPIDADGAYISEGSVL